MTQGPEALFADFSASLLGGNLPPGAERHLALAAQTYHLGDIAESHLFDAEAQAPDHAAVLIGLYRFYFYKGHLGQALEIAQRCLDKAARELALPADWRLTRPDHARFDSFDDMAPRFFLFSLKGYGYLHMRLGNLAMGRAALEKLLELDPSDKIGAGVLVDVLKRAEAGEDD
jgi:tetratricopeptide (TPR) repeat protein